MISTTRGACLVNGDEESLIDDSMDETIGPVRFLHDQRLLKPAYYYYTGEHVTLNSYTILSI